MNKDEIKIEDVSSSDEREDYKLKVVIVGDSGVGKSNLIKRFTTNEFNEHSKATVGVEFLSRSYKINDKIFKIEMWDTAGQERYKAITSAYYKGAKGAFVVYDITRKTSFESIDRWVNDLTAAADKKITIVVIGNKCDLEDQRQITKEQGEEKSAKLEVAFLETSALSGENLDKAFELMMNEIYKKCHEEMLAENDLEIIDGGKDINLKKNENTEKKKCC